MNEQKPIEVYRRMSDGITISTYKLMDSPEWIRVSIKEPMGGFLFDGMMRVTEAFTEIPFQLDRARTFLREWQQKQEAEKRAESIVTEKS